MFLACLALNDARLAFAAADSPVRGGEPDTPCWPNLISLMASPSLAKTACDLVGCLGVRLGLLYPSNCSPRYVIIAVVLASALTAF